MARTRRTREPQRGRVRRVRVTEVQGRRVPRCGASEAGGSGVAAATSWLSQHAEGQYPRVSGAHVVMFANHVAVSGAHVVVVVE